MGFRSASVGRRHLSRGRGDAAACRDGQPCRSGWYLFPCRHLVAPLSWRRRLERVLRYTLGANECLAPFGIRSLSRLHLAHPYVVQPEGDEYRDAYIPSKSDNDLFGATPTGGAWCGFR